MAIPQDIIKAMVASLHQRHLKSLGFRKSGTTWIRPMEWNQIQVAWHFIRELAIRVSRAQAQAGNHETL